MTPLSAVPGGIALVTTQTVTPTDEEPLVAPPEEEAPPEEVAPEAAPPEGEDAGTPGEEADPEAQIVEAVQGLLKENPALAEKLGIKAPEDEQLPPDEALHRERYAFDAQKRQDVLRSKAAAVLQPKSVKAALQSQLQGLEQQARAALRQAASAKDSQGYPVELDPDKVPLGEHQKLIDASEYYVQEAGKAGADYAYTDTQNAVLDLLESHPVHRSLNAEEKQARDYLLSGKAVDEDGRPLGRAGALGALAIVYLEAASRNAPAEVTKKAEAEANKKVKLTEAQTKLLEIVKGSANGAKLAGGRGTGTKRYADMTMDERAALSPEQRDAIIQRDAMRRPR